MSYAEDTRGRKPAPTFESKNRRRFSIFTQCVNGIKSYKKNKRRLKKNWLGFNGTSVWFQLWWSRVILSGVHLLLITHQKLKTYHFQTFCHNYPHIIDFALVDFVITPVIQATLKIPTWLSDWLKSCFTDIVFLVHNRRALTTKNLYNCLHKNHNETTTSKMRYPH